MTELTPRVAEQLAEYRERKARQRAVRAEFARRRAYGVQRRHEIKLGLDPTEPDHATHPAGSPDS